MRFVDDGPMRAAPRGAQFLQPRQQSGEEGRAMIERDPEEVYDDVLRRLVEQFEDLVHVRRAAVVAQDHRAFEGRVIAFRVNYAELIAPLSQALEKAAGQSRFPDAGRSRDQKVDAVGLQSDLFAVFAHAEQYAVALKSGLDLAQVVAEQRLAKLDHAIAVVAPRHPIGLLFDRRQRVGHRHRTFAEAEKSVVVFGVADAYGVVRRESQLVERRLEPSRLVHARRQNHDRALIEDHLKFQPQVVYGFQDGRLVRLPGGDDGMPDRDRPHAALSEKSHEILPRRLGEQLLFALLRAMEQRAVFGDNPIEKIKVREVLSQVI